MPGLRLTGFDGNTAYRTSAPGDIFLSGEIIAPLTTVGAGTLTAALITSGIIRRTGPTGDYTDTTDTAANILNALAGNTGNNSNVMPGSTFRFLFINGVAFIMTFAGGLGVVVGAAVNVAASVNREYLVTVLNSTPQTLFGQDTANANPALSFANTGLSIQDQLARLDAIDVGMVVSGAGITAGTTVIGINFATRVITLSANATATANNVGITFMPSVRIDGLRASTA